MNLILNTTLTAGTHGTNAQGTLTVTTVVATTVSSAHPLSVVDLAHACGADVAWVCDLVALGIVGQSDTTQRVEARFQSADLQSALEVIRLQRDFGVELEAAALMFDLQREVRRLKSIIQTLGLSSEP